jgi:hypothetical protein
VALALASFAPAWADGQQAPPAAPPPKKDAPQTSARAVSPQIAAELAATIPKYQPAQPVAANPVAPATDVVHMPTYLVSGSKLPMPMDVLTQEGLESYAMDRYLGPSDGLDRGVLNAVTLAELWPKIPVVGAIPMAPFGSTTNGERAVEQYEADKRLQEKADLLELVSLMKLSGDAEGSAKLKDEVNQTFK